MEIISKERKEEILKQFENNKALFNWCEEYKEFVNNCVLGCVTTEWNYMLKKSYEDDESPIDYNDLDLFDIDHARETILYEFDNISEELKEYANNINSFNRKVKTKEDFEIFLKSLDKEELKALIDEFSNNIELSDCEGEVYEWWIIKDSLKYRLEQQGEIFLNDAWGRQTTGQSISLDYCIIKAFIDELKGLSIWNR